MSRQSLRSFGTIFMGPMLYFFSRRIEEQLNNTNENQIELSQPEKPVISEPLYFLAREGHWLQPAFNASTEQSERVETIYLLASRAFLFKVTLDDPRSYPLSLKGDFNGSLKDLLVKRFLLPAEKVSTLFSSSELNKRLLLPNDYSKVVSLFAENNEKLTQLVADSKAAYLTYLNDMGATQVNTLHCVDVGYSGTIQKLLSLLLNKDSVGHYLIASESGEQSFAGNHIKMLGCLNENVKMRDGYVPLDRSMFLESLLTAPQGQLRDMRPVQDELASSKWQPVFGREVNSQRFSHELAELMAGAIDYCDHCKDHAIEFTKQEIESIYTRFVTKNALFPRTAHRLFSLDDDVTGNETLDPLQFWGIK